MNTQPMPLAQIAAAPGGIGAYRLASALEISALLRRIQDGGIEVNLNAPQGAVCTTTLWAADAARDLLSFAADPDDPALHKLLEGDEAVAVAYLDSVRIQFDVDRLVLVHGERSCALSCAFPREVIRFQRRQGYRVRPTLRDAPTATLRLPGDAGIEHTLRVLDLSIGGCALLLPEDQPPPPAGVLLPAVSIELDPQTRFVATLRLQHVSSIQADSRALRLGCELTGAGPEALRCLQRYIDQTQKRRRFAPA